MAFKKQHLALGMALLLATAGVIALNHWLQPPRQAPDLTFELLDGRKVSRASFLGRPLLVLFWATSCKTCVAEIPALKRFYREFRPRGLELIAVAMPYDPPNYVKKFNARYHLPYPIALDTMGKMVHAFGDVPGTPTIYLISGEGHIVYRVSGKIDIVDLRQRVGALIRTARQSAKEAT